MENPWRSRLARCIWVAVCGWLGTIGAVAADDEWQAQILEPPAGFDYVGVQRISADGSIRAGQICDSSFVCQAFVWSAAAGYRTLILPGDVRSEFVALATDGSTLLGRSCNAQLSDCRGFVWREGADLVELILPGDVLARDLAMSEDGSTVIGYSLGAGLTRGFVWTAMGGIRALILDGDVWVRDLTVATQGATVAGTSCPTQVSSACRAFVWTARQGLQPLFLENHTLSSAPRLSADGSTAISTSLPGSFSIGTGLIWTRDEGIVNLGLHRQPGLVSADGSVVTVVVSTNRFIWTREFGLQPLTLEDATNVRVDGIAGNGFLRGTLTKAGQRRGFVWSLDQGIQLLELGGESRSDVRALTANGTAVGASRYADGLVRGWVWNPGDDAPHPLILDSDPDAITLFSLISDDGLTAVGSTASNVDPKALVWTRELGVQLMILEGDSRSSFFSRGLSQDASTVLGQSCIEAQCRNFAWNAPLGTKPLVVDGYLWVFAYLTSADGSLVIGEACDDFRCDGVVWTRPSGGDDEEPVASTVGMVTGGGWINAVSGRASFGLVSRYQAGRDAPSGNVQFQADGLSFTSSRQEWLVIEGGRARFQAAGTVNGAGNYRLLMTVSDAALTPDLSVDQVQIRIWNSDDGAVMYDNQAALAGGSVVIHQHPGTGR
ncbi:MAG: hypothetical protein ACNA7W_07820 [Pseudomonadales bacterium]